MYRKYIVPQIVLYGIVLFTFSAIVTQMYCATNSIVWHSIFVILINEGRCIILLPRNELCCPARRPRMPYPQGCRWLQDFGCSGPLLSSGLWGVPFAVADGKRCRPGFQVTNWLVLLTRTSNRSWSLTGLELLFSPDS